MAEITLELPAPPEMTHGNWVSRKQFGTPLRYRCVIEASVNQEMNFQALGK